MEDSAQASLVAKSRAWGQHTSMINREWGDLELHRAHIKAFKITVSFSVAKHA